MKQSLLLLFLLAIVYPVSAEIVASNADYNMSINLSSGGFNQYEYPSSLDIKYADIIARIQVENPQVPTATSYGLNILYSDLKSEEELKKPELTLQPSPETVRVKYADILYRPNVNVPPLSTTVEPPEIKVKYSDLLFSTSIKKPEISLQPSPETVRVKYADILGKYNLRTPYFERTTSYGIRVKYADILYTKSLSSPYQIPSQISVSISTDRISYIPSSWVTITATVKDDAGKTIGTVMSKSNFEVFVDGNKQDIEDFTKCAASYILKIKAPDQIGEHDVKVRVSYSGAEAWDSATISVSEIEAKVWVGLDDNVDQATRNWKFKTKYNKPVFRRGIDNPTFYVSIADPSYIPEEVKFEIYAPTDNGYELKSTIYADQSTYQGYKATWRWIDENYNELDKLTLPVGIYLVKAYVDGSYVGKSNFYVIFDFDEDDSPFVCHEKDYAINRFGLLKFDINLHQYNSKIFLKAIEAINGSVNIIQAVDKIAHLARNITGESTYHHMLDDERDAFKKDEYNNDFDNQIDESDEVWYHNYEAILNPFGLIYVSDKSLFIIRNENGYLATYLPDILKTVKGAWWRDSIKFIESDFRPYPIDGLDENPNIENWPKHPVGVCEDYAMLTIAYLRSVGLPAKLISGWSAYILFPRGHNWVWYYNGNNWNHLDPDYTYNRTKWEVYHFDKRLSLDAGTVDKVYTTIYEREKFEIADITELYKPNIKLSILQVKDVGSYWYIEFSVEYLDSKCDLDLVGDFCIWGDVYKYSSGKWKFITKLRFNKDSNYSLSSDLVEGETIRGDVYLDKSVVSSIDIVKLNIYLGSSTLAEVEFEISDYLQQSQTTKVLTYESETENEQTEGIEISPNTTTFTPGIQNPLTLTIANPTNEGLNLSIVMSFSPIPDRAGARPFYLYAGDVNVSVPADSTITVETQVVPSSILQFGDVIFNITAYSNSTVVYTNETIASLIPIFSTVYTYTPVKEGENTTLTISIMNSFKEELNVTTKIETYHLFTEPESKSVVIPPYSSSSVSFELKALKSGNNTIMVSYITPYGSKSEDIAIFVKSNPSYSIDLTVPDTIYYNESFTVLINVTNVGDVAGLCNITVDATGNVTLDWTSEQLLINAHDSVLLPLQILAADDFLLTVNASGCVCTYPIDVLSPSLEMSIIIPDSAKAPSSINATLILNNTGDVDLPVSIDITNREFLYSFNSFVEVGSSKTINVSILVFAGLNKINVTVKYLDTTFNITTYLLGINVTGSTAYDVERNNITLTFRLRSNTPGYVFLRPELILEIEQVNGNFSQNMSEIIPKLSDEDTIQVIALPLPNGVFKISPKVLINNVSFDLQEIIIQIGAKIVSCDEFGNEKNYFSPGDNVYVRGCWLEPNTQYKIWIQKDPVSLGDELVEAEDPSGYQEVVTTNDTGCFSPTLIWGIDANATPSYNKYDIVVDKIDENAGVFDSVDGIDDAIVAGFVAPIPEIFTVLLVAAGLVLILILRRFI